MVVLGIDPGLATIGFGVIEYKNGRFYTIDYGAILTPPDLPVEDRLLMIHDEMAQLINMYKPSEVAIEELFFNTNRKTAITVAEARGVILLACKKSGLDIFEYTPLQVKQALVGYGRAEKKQIMVMVKSFLGLDHNIKLDDTADALAIAICHAHTGSSKLKNFYNLK
ncbi:MAG: crossover junction endodeoxyribonuclease RuvC [Ruminococcaceae bacterium]|nr:crossover junction endodeoxyribonuclease RuvC [Oscillospiraceae bacterium]